MKALSPWFSTARLVQSIQKVLAKQSAKTPLSKTKSTAASPGKQA